MLEDFDPDNRQATFKLTKFVWTGTATRVAARKVCFRPHLHPHQPPPPPPNRPPSHT